MPDALTADPGRPCPPMAKMGGARCEAVGGTSPEGEGLTGRRQSKAEREQTKQGRAQAGKARQSASRQSKAEREHAKQGRAQADKVRQSAFNERKADGKQAKQGSARARKERRSASRQSKAEREQTKQGRAGGYKKRMARNLAILRKIINESSCY